MKKTICLLLSLVMLLSLVACTAQPAETASAADSSTGTAGAATEAKTEVAPQKAAEITVNLCEPKQSLISLDLYKYSQHTAWQYGEMVYDALLTADYTGNYEYNLCTSYELADDGLSAVLHLAEGVVFQDGTVCDAKDVVTTMNYLAENLDTLAMISTVWANLGSAEIIDDYTVKVNLTSKSHVFECALGYTFIFSDEDFEKYGDAMWSEGIINGTGPWLYEEWVDGQYIMFARNDNYWKGQKSNIDHVRFWYVSEPSAQVSGLLSGELDYCATINYDQLSMVEGDKNLTVYTYPTDSMSYLQFSMQPGSPFADINVRKAAVHAIDLEALLTLCPGGRAMNCAATIGADGYRDDLPLPAYDPELAKQLLAESNYKGEPIEIWSWTSESDYVSAIAAYMEAVGFKMSINLTDSAGFSAIRSKGDYTMFFGGVATWDGDLMTQYIVPRILQDCHKSGYVDEKINDLIARADVELDRETRKAMLEEVIGMLYDNYGPIVGAIQKGGYEVTRNGLLGVHPTYGGCAFYRDVYVDEAVWGK